MVVRTSAWEHAERSKNTQKEIFTLSKECLKNLKGKYFENIEFNAGLRKNNFLFLSYLLKKEVLSVQIENKPQKIHKTEKFSLILEQYKNYLYSSG
jgi:hypothetical protein